MEPRLTRGENWLLNAVVEAGVPLKFLASDDVEGLFNKRGHLMERAKLIELLCGLHSRGWIKADQGDDSIPIDEAMVESAFMADYDPRNDQAVCYRLTATGGDAWEAFAAPRWDRYLRTRLNFSAKSGYVEGADESRVEEYVSKVHLFGWNIVKESIVREKLEPYQATYWKTLPYGFRVEYQYCGVRERPRWDQVPHRLTNLQRWYDWE